jgi:hypothetical protein
MASEDSLIDGEGQNSNDSQDHFPWQYLWKNPTLKPITRTRTTADDVWSNQKDVDNRPPCDDLARKIAAARLNEEEMERCIVLANETVQADFTQTERPYSGILSAKLLNKKDSIQLELVDGISKEVLHQTMLHWPISAYGREKLQLHDIVFCRHPAIKKQKHGTATTSGSISLRRREYYRSLDKRKTEEQRGGKRGSQPFRLKQQLPCLAPSMNETTDDISDALDTLRLLSLSLGMDATLGQREFSSSLDDNLQDLAWASSMTPTEELTSGDEIEEIPSNEDKQSEDSEEDGDVQPDNEDATGIDLNGCVVEECLTLCLIEINGTLHWYDALGLMALSSAAESEESNDGVATFFFGSMFSDIQRQLLPLAAPHPTTQLSIALDSRALSEGRTPRRRPVNPMLDMGILNAAIEPTSNMKRTTTNHISCSLATKEYLVVGGKGFKKKTKQNGSEASSGFDVQRGGWLTFVSLKPERHYEEARTTFLPFAVGALHFVQWNGMDLLLVITDNLKSTPAEYKSDKIFAVRMDAGLSRVACRDTTTKPSLYSSLAEMFDESAATPHSPNKNKGNIYVRIRRFDVFPLRLDDLYVEDALPSVRTREDMFGFHAELTHVSVSQSSQPPSIILSYIDEETRTHYLESHSFSEFGYSSVGSGFRVFVSARRHDGNVATLGEVKHYDSKNEFCFSGQVSVCQ